MNQPSKSYLPSNIFQMAIYITMAFGAGMVFFPEMTFEFFGFLLFQDTSALFNWPEDAKRYVKLAHAVMGSVMLGWAILMLWVARTRFPESGNHVIKALSASLWLWYLPDTAASLFHGFWQNALFNTGFLMMLLGPLYLQGVYLGSKK